MRVIQALFDSAEAKKERGSICRPIAVAIAVVFAPFSLHRTNAPVPQHLAEHSLVELEKQARLWPPGDDEVATLGVRREERHLFCLLGSERKKKKQLRGF